MSSQISTPGFTTPPPPTRSSAKPALSAAASPHSNEPPQSRCYAKGTLAPAFLFSLNDPARDNTTHFVPTLVYQLAGLDPGIRATIVQCIDSDPLVFKKSLRSQMDVLVISPLRPAHLTAKLSGTHSPISSSSTASTNAKTSPCEPSSSRRSNTSSARSQPSASTCASSSPADQNGRSGAPWRTLGSSDT